MEEKFWEECESEKLEEVKEIIRVNPAIDASWKNKRDDTSALLQACFHAHGPIVSILLVHPATDVNWEAASGHPLPLCGPA